MVLTLAIILMAVARSYSSRSEGTVVRLPVRSRRVGLPVFGLAVALALVSLPSAAWASASTSPVGEGTSVSERTGAISSAKSNNAGAAPQASEYAAREAQARGLEKFQGGDTTVIIGGSALIIIIVVILILVLI